MRYISIDEYLMNRVKLQDLSSEIIGNINTLIPKINELLERFGQYRGVNSGIRTTQDQIEIYKHINAKRLAVGLSQIKTPMASRHLFGDAIDVEDHDDELKKWVKANVHILEELGLYCEDFAYTDTWVHFQTTPPKSGKRFFIP